MGTILLIVSGVIIVFAIIGAISARDEPGNGSKVGCLAGFSFILNLLPYIVSVIIIIALVKACSE